MRSKQLSYLAFCTALVAGPALAQSAPADGADGFAAPEEIIVTAQRRDQRLQDVPLAVTAISSNSLENAQVMSVEDLPVLAPSLVINEFGNATVLFIRGVGSLDGSPGQEAAVALYVDGVYRAAPFAANQQLSNIERVEVLKGPQGTLFGRNATGGAVQIITKKPSETTSGNFTVGYGNFDTIEGNGYITTGLGDGVAADLAVAYNKQRDGWGKNLATGTEIYRSENFVARSRWNLQPSDNLEIDLAGEYLHRTSNNDVRTPLPGVTFLDGQTFANFGGGFYDARQGLDPKFRVKGGSLSARVDFDGGPIRVSSITSYAQYDSASQFDQEGTTQPILDLFLDAKFRTFTQELQFMSPKSSSIEWIGGLFYMKDRSGFLGANGINFRGFGVDLDPSDGPDIANLATIAPIRTQAMSIFAEATFPLGDQTRLTVGGRYSRDRRQVTAELRILDPAVLSRTAAVLAVVPLGSYKATFKEPTWRAILDHKINSDVMVYASVSRGFKSGNFNAVSPNTAPFQPEILTAYETGIKSELFDRRLRLNVSGYFYKYKDIQLSAVQGTTLVTQNAASADLAGGEIEGTWAPGGGFQLNFNAAYSWSKFKAFPTGILYVPNAAGGSTTLAPFDHSGERLPKSPKLTFSISPSYKIVTDVGNVNLSATWSHSSRYRFEASSLVYQPKHDLINARIGWSTLDDSFGAALWVRNLLDKKLYRYAFGQALGNGYFAAAPRTYGAQLNYNF